MLSAAASLAVMLAQPSTGAIRLLVRADDMGATHGITVGCLESVTRGIARSIEVITPGPWFPETIRLLKEHPEIDTGVHIALTSEWDAVRWRPLTRGPSLVDAEGYLPKRPDPKQTLADIEAEIRAQIELGKKHMPRLTHVTSHMAVVSQPRLREMTTRLAKEFGLVFEPTMQRMEVALGHALPPAEKEKNFLEALSRLGPGTWLLVTHPSPDTPEMRAVGHAGYSDVAQDRDGILKMLQSARVRAMIAKRGIQLVSYADLK